MLAALPAAQRARRQRAAGRLVGRRRRRPVAAVGRHQRERLASRPPCARCSPTTAPPRSTPTYGELAGRRPERRAGRRDRGPGRGHLPRPTPAPGCTRPCGPTRSSPRSRCCWSPRARPGQSGRLLAPLRTLRETADEITETDLSQRLPGHRQRRHHRAHPDLQRDARPAGGGVRRPAAVPRRRRPRAEDPADRAARPPRAARHRQPRGGRRDPRAAARRDRPDVAAGRRPDPARQERPARLPAAPAGRPRPASPPTCSPRRAASATATGSSTGPPSVKRRRRRAAAHPGACSSSPTTRSSTPAPATWSRSARRTTATAARLWVRDTGPGVPAEDREQIFERFGRSAVPAGDEGFGLGLSIVRRHRARRTAARVAVEDAEPHGARFVVTPASDADPATDRRGGRGHVARILIVEDEERIASFVSKGLRADGHLHDRPSPTAARASTTR